MIYMLKFYTKFKVNDTSHVANVSYKRRLNSAKLWALKFWQWCQWRSKASVMLCCAFS